MALLSIPRTLNLGLAEDRALLAEAAQGDPDLPELLNYLDRYLGWFPGPEWRKIYSGGLVASPKTASGKGGQMYTIGQLLHLTERLSSLEQYEGFETLLRGLSNPTQVSATVFEIRAAAWCSARSVSTELQFSPQVLKASGPKYPDFLWQTSLGAIICECKEANQWQRREAQRIERLLDLAAGPFEECACWPEHVRLDIVVGGRLPADADHRIQALVRRAIAATVGTGDREPITDSAFVLTIRDKTDEPVVPADSITTGRQIVGDTPTQLGARSAYVTVARSLAATRSKTVTSLMKDAKTQLPEQGPGAVFIEMPGADAAIARLQRSLGHPAHQAVHWASVWTGGILRHAVWRNDQPFDARLLA